MYNDLSISNIKVCLPLKKKKKSLTFVYISCLHFSRISSTFIVFLLDFLPSLGNAMILSHLKIADSGCCSYVDVLRACLVSLTVAFLIVW